MTMSLPDKRTQAYEEAKATREAAQKAARTQAPPEKPSLFQTTIMNALKKMIAQYDSESAMARATNVSQSTINKVLSGKQVPRLDAVGKLMDSVGARVIFPWDKTIHKVVLAGSAATALPTVAAFSAVAAFSTVAAAVPGVPAIMALLGKEGKKSPEYLEVPFLACQKDADGKDVYVPASVEGMVFPAAMLRSLGPELGLYMVLVPENMKFMTTAVKPGDLIMLDMRKKPAVGEESAYLVRMPDGTHMLGRAALKDHNGQRMLIISGADAPQVLVEGRSCKNLEDAVIGKVVYVMGRL
jgi:DNA-binding phage protein